MLVSSRYRLVTRSDFDGLVCAVLLKELDLIDDISFVHPKDMQDGVVPITDRDITTNLPYVDGAHLVFDHHASETVRNEPRENHIIDPAAPSAARVVYDFYGGPSAFPGISEEMMAAVDKADSAAVRARRGARPPRLGAPQLRDGRPDRAGPLPRLPDLELRPDDAAHRRVPAPRHRGGARAPRRGGAGGPLPRAGAAVPRPAAAAAPPSSATSPWSTSATRSRSTPATASWSTRCTPR